MVEANEMTDGPPACNTHPDLVAFTRPLLHFRDSLKRQRKTRIVALGSSSTAGANNVLPFPGRLEFLLRQGQFGRLIDVVNRGIGGQESPEELSRLECDVIAEDPALVIWQVGTNAVFHAGCYNLDEVEAAIAIGLDLLADLPTDVVLMDLQYTTALVSDPAKLKLSEEVENRIAKVAANAKVNLFKRWELMKTWCRVDHVALTELDDKGEFNLHMSEWATACTTQALHDAIASAPVA
jgi:hypothetical protein